MDATKALADAEKALEKLNQTLKLVQAWRDELAAAAELDTKDLWQQRALTWDDSTLPEGSALPDHYLEDTNHTYDL
jgi:hypothetical protein